MNSLNKHNFVIGKKISNRTSLTKFIVCLFFIFLILINFTSINNSNNQANFSNNNIISKNENPDEINLINPKNSNSIPEASDPFTVNFSKIWNYFRTTFKSNLTDYDISTYIRERTNIGGIVDSSVYSLDNLLLYYTSFDDPGRTQTETFETFMKLKSTPLWYDNQTNFEYGFVGEIDGDDGEILDSNRYLIGNVMPIYLLLEGATTNLVNINYGGYNAKEEFEKAFFLINSSVFYDNNDIGFISSNSTGPNDRYQMKENFYTILANYLIHQSRDYISNTIADRAYFLASNVTESLVMNMWDNANLGFYKSANESWAHPEPYQSRKYLDVNALGILTLLEYYIQNEGMYDTNQYLENATLLYDLLESNLFDLDVKAYNLSCTPAWGSVSDSRIDLEANSIMLRACLKLFEVTGEFKYYQRAFDLYQYIEGALYNSTISAYEKSIGTQIDKTNINFHANLRLIESHLDVLKIYDSVLFSAEFNETGNDFIFNQGVLNITCDYTFEKQITSNNLTIYSNITDGSIVYTLRYSNNTIINEYIFDILESSSNYYYDDITNTSNFIYPITEDLPVDMDYSITIKINSTYFRFKNDNLTFNIIYGLERIGSIEGLNKIKEEDDFYQGQTENITIEIFSNYNHNLTLNVSIYGFGISNYTQSLIKFENISSTFIEFDIEAQFDAIHGERSLTIIIGNGSNIYLDFDFNIFITDALTYENLIYQSEVVPGNNFQVTLDLINYLSSNIQSLNLTFTGEYLAGQSITPITLEENERKQVSLSIFVSSQIDVDSIEVDMNILKGNNTIKSQKLTVNIIPKFEILSINFPEKVIQDVPTQLILIIKNNEDSSKEFTLRINDKKQNTNIEELVPGENRIEVEVLPTLNPYEFGYKKFYIELEDEDDNVILTDYFESEIQLSTINLLIFYVLPLVIPIGIILYYKNKEIKIKLLRR